MRGVARACSSCRSCHVAAAAARVLAAHIRCLLIARHADRCSNECAQCHRHVVMMRLACLHGVCCAAAQPCAAERCLTLTGVNAFSGVHASFPCSFFAVQRLSLRLTWHDFAYITMAQKVRSGSVVPPFPSQPHLFRKIWLLHARLLWSRLARLRCERWERERAERSQ